MQLSLGWIDFYWADRLFGLGIGSIVTENWIRNLLSAYWNDGELLVDVLWFRVYTGFPYIKFFNSED